MTQLPFDAKKLDEAICNVARKQFYAHLRESLIFGPPEIAMVYGEYLKLTEPPPKKRRPKKK